MADKISFAEVCRGVADYLYNETGGCEDPCCYKHTSLREDTAALRALAALVERAAEINADLERAEWPNETAAHAFGLLHELAAGYEEAPTNA